MNMGMKKYGGGGDAYQQQIGGSRPYIKGDYYNVELQANNQVLSSPRMSNVPPLGSRMSPRGG